MPERYGRHPGPPEEYSTDEVENHSEDNSGNFPSDKEVARRLNPTPWMRFKKWLRNNKDYLAITFIDFVGLITSATPTVDQIHQSDVVEAAELSADMQRAEEEMRREELEDSEEQAAGQELGPLEVALLKELARLEDEYAYLLERYHIDDDEEPYQGPDQVEIGDKDEPKDS